MKFVGELPPSKAPGAAPDSLVPVIAALRENPGQWAELSRYSKERRSSAASRGHQIRRRHDGIEYATRSDGDEVVLYLRAVAS